MREARFIKMDRIQPGRHCYNIMGSIIDVEHKVVTKNNKEVNIAEGWIGDETAKANFKIEGKFAELMKKNTVVAIRNGKCNLFYDKVRLEIDSFGKITSENTIIEKINENNNLSAQEYVKVYK